MNVVYSGGTICSYTTLKRLVVIADEIGFIDRPSITFNNWGTIGSASEFRRFDTSDAPIAFSVHKTPSGPVNRLYQSYIEADLRNPRFINFFIEGLRNDTTFRSRFIQMNANYPPGRPSAPPAHTGKEVIDALLADKGLLAAPLSGEVNPPLIYDTYSAEGRRETLKVLLIEASIHVTNALIISEETSLVPVSDDPYFCRLLAIRTYDSQYVRETPRYAPLLGLSVAKSVLPDQLLAEVDIQDLFSYRSSAKDSYRAWSTEINKLAVRLGDINPDTADRDIKDILKTEINPKLIEYRNEMKTARDKLFGELVKKVMKWEVPTLYVAHLVSLDLTSALFAFASAMTPALHSVVDYFMKRREIKRHNSMSYLIGITSEEPDDR